MQELVVFGACEKYACHRVANFLLTFIEEAAKLGFTVALVPKANAPKKAIAALEVHAVERVEEALNLVRSLV